MTPRRESGQLDELGIAVGLLQFVRELKIGSAARKTDAR
jgi:hypothetical protein